VSEMAIGGTLEREEPERFAASFRADLFRHFVYVPGITFAKKAALCLQVEGIWACFVYRFGRALKTGAFPGIGWIVYRFLEIVVRIASGIHLDVEARIAPGFYVGHHGSIFVGPGVRIGPNSSIGQMCYVAAAAIGSGAPSIGEKCHLGAGCKVIGSVRIGDRAAIGAAAVVLEDVPASAVVVGNPGRIVSYKGTDDMIYLGGGPVPVTGERALRSMIER
jgi:serine O-acetyltransferase